MQSPRKLPFLIASALALAVLGSLAAGPPPVVIVTLRGEGDAIVAQWPMAAGEELQLGFIHSSEHVRVSSVFRAGRGELHARETWFEGLGPGLPLDGVPADTGGLVSQQAMALTRLTVRVGPDTGHWLNVSGQSIDLSATVPPGRRPVAYTIEVESPSLLCAYFRLCRRG